MAVFNTYEKDPETEKREFIQILYQDKKGGQMIRLRKDGTDVTQFSTCDVDELLATGTDTASYYTTINTFCGWKRTADRVFNFTSIYIDLDCHADDLAEILVAKEKTVQILEEAYKNGELSIPTMITDTGRGFGIQYVLTKSIANTWKTEKMIAFFKKVRKCIFEKYQALLSTDPQAAQADPAVLEDARVCRLPGTYNAKAGKMCRLISASEKYYELSELVQGCKLWPWKPEEEYRKKRKAKVASGKMVSFNDYKMPFLSARLEQLEKLQTLRGKDCAGCREQMLFIAYSTLVQLDYDTAAEYLKAFNGRFAEPLDQCELDHIVEETDQSVGYDHRGYYKLKNTYLVERLDLTDAEIKAIGLDMGWKRTAERQAARETKKKEREMIIELLKQVETLTYDEIAETVGVSRRKVCMIAKAEGLMRYAKAAKRQQEEKKDKIISIDIVREAHGQTDESAKNATRSVCVLLPTTPRTLFSTSAERGSGGEETDWYTWLEKAASASVVAKELIELYDWATSYRTDVPGMEDLFDKQMPFIIKHPEDRLPGMLTKASKMFFAYHGLEECLMILSMHIVYLPTLEDLCKQKREREELRKQKKKNPIVDPATETPEQHEARIGKYLAQYKDDRFAVIEKTEEYARRLDPAVLRTFKVACMQVERLKQESFWIEREKIPTVEIKQCFNSLTYKDIVTICERMGHQGTIQNAAKPFFYVMQCAWKYKHPDAAEAQTERLHIEKAAEKSKNGFHNFAQRTYDFDFGKFMEINSMREITGQPLLSKEEYIDLFEAKES